MAITTVKSTYSLDVETVRELEEMARAWKVSKSEALRRSIRSAATEALQGGNAIEALDELQEALRLTPARALAWARRARAERRATSARRETRGR